MRDFNGGPKFNDTRPDQEPDVERGSETTERVCIRKFPPQTEGTVRCDLAGRCIVTAVTDKVHDVATGEDSMETMILLGDKCVVGCLGNAILSAITSPEA